MFYLSACGPKLHQPMFQQKISPAVKTQSELPSRRGHCCLTTCGAVQPKCPTTAFHPKKPGKQFQNQRLKGVSMKFPTVQVGAGSRNSGGEAVVGMTRGSCLVTGCRRRLV